MKRGLWLRGGDLCIVRRTGRWSQPASKTDRGCLGYIYLHFFLFLFLSSFSYINKSHSSKCLMEQVCYTPAARKTSQHLSPKVRFREYQTLTNQGNNQAKDKDRALCRYYCSLGACSIIWHRGYQAHHSLHVDNSRHVP